MITVDIKDLRVGMITATPTFSPSGQLILPEHSLLTSQQISRLEFYSVAHVLIVPEKELHDSALTELSENKETTSYSQKLRRSKAFHHFKTNYEHKIEFLQHSLNDLVTKNIPIDTNALLEQVTALYSSNLTTLSIFDMLHNMRMIDDSTYAHSMNVALIARMMGEWMDYQEEDLNILTLCGLLHDVGKCMVPEGIIDKPTSLTDEEFAEVKKHPRYGAEILKNQPLDNRIKMAALMHHERCDGTGYPFGIQGDEIPDFAKIISIADVYDAMTANRCYRKGLCPFEVIATFERDGLQKYDSHFILAFLSHIVDTYISNYVVLNNGTCGKIILMNQQALSRPIIHTVTDEYVDLTQHPELYIQAIV
ncbi:MAG: HD-GYP domain-containing protein [Lachnospiraceae bacterium]